MALELAMAAAVRGDVSEWVHEFLEGPGGNRALSEGLKKAPRWWRGPLRIRLQLLHRCCGPEPEMEFPQDPASWRQRVADLVDYLERGGQVAPLIAEYRAGLLSVRDGSHRVGAFNELGHSWAWALVWYNSESDFRAHGSDPCQPHP